ncbi:MAG TPA: hypothetical protein VEL28_18885 [Candidatus Binatia bacterium]|nr:hypothetical protein [Candidatus Binatia bacterium]
MRTSILDALLILAGAAAMLAVPLGYRRWSAGMDWHYFDSLSWLVRSSVLHYRVLPLHDPWMCGGVDVGANPQSRLLSPLMLADLALTPHDANLVTLYVFAAAGLASMTALLRHLGHTRALSMLGGLLFTGSTWFALHWSEGHLRFAPIAVLPLFVLALLRLDERRMQLTAATLMSFFMLEGAIYAFVYALYLAIALTIAGMVPWRRTLQGARKAPWFTLTVLAATAALVAAKALPIRMLHDTAPRKVETGALFSELPRILLWPQQSRHHVIDLEYRFHEYGLYLGVAAIACVAWSLKDRGYRRQVWRWLVVALVFFWAATNWLAPLSPWTLMQNLPLLRNAHVPSRLFVLFHIAWIVLLIGALARLRHRRILLATLAAFLAMETFWISTNTWRAAYSWGKPTLRVAAMEKPIDVERWQHTIETAVKPGHYGKGLGSRYCYEPVQTHRNARSAGQSGYLGEIHLRSGKGTVDIEKVTPGTVTLNYAGGPSAIAEVNLNTLGGWTVERGNADVLSERHRLTVKFRRPGPVTLRYSPPYWPLAMWLWTGGAILLSAAWLVALLRPWRRQSGPAL